MDVSLTVTPVRKGREYVELTGTSDGARHSAAGGDSVLSVRTEGPLV